MPNQHVCFGIIFCNSFSKKGKAQLLRTRFLRSLAYQKKKAEEAKAKGPAVSHRRIHCQALCEYVNQFFYIYLKNILFSCSMSFTFIKFHVLLLIMMPYCHKIGKYINQHDLLRYSSLSIKGG